MRPNALVGPMRWWYRTRVVRAITGAAAATITCLPVGVLAADLQLRAVQHCARDGKIRTVEWHAAPPTGLPCEVRHLKPDEGATERIVWSARIERGFCAARFDDFIDKQESRFGWACEAGSVEPAVAAASPDATPRAAVDAEAAELRPAQAFERLRALVPPGDYVAVPVANEARDGARRVEPFCPSGGPFDWRVDDPQRPVLTVGKSIEIAVQLGDTVPEPGGVLGIVASVGAGFTRDLQSLSPGAADGGLNSPGVDLRIVPRGPGSGALSPGVCRYALQG